jgi:hypothetical protein
MALESRYLCVIQSMTGSMSTGPRKDRLIQTRVDEELESALKEEATRRRLPVSQLVRNIL